ncbi:MAG TPA: Hsp70 family protein, partial [candidate division Zixibacteria bacterium]|nr:Hsp70 family protein [candidate division Zixibacteria bacterium]
MSEHFLSALRAQLRAHGQAPLRVIGIDLGTTNCTVAEIVADGAAEDFEPRCIEIEQETPFQGEYTHILIPSIVALHGGREYVGEGAKRLRAGLAGPETGLERNRTIFWEVKNEMGIQRTYARAPEGYRGAAEVSGRILRFLANRYRADHGEPRKAVVTVPASFQQPQREDTLRAAKLASMELAGGDLLDEPLAAFVDFWMRGELAKALPRGEGNVLVFDFGGGTCDTAVVKVHAGDAAGHLRASPLSVSRYYRLGGGDIDLAIFYEVLLPQIMEQNGLSERDLDFGVKKNQLEPAFLGIAESLKVGLCTQVRRLRELARGAELPIEPVQKLPATERCRLTNGREITLQSPALTLPQFEAVLEPFLDRTFVFHRETEYRLTCSIFAPLEDALDRAELDAREIDCCLLVGGSSLIPQVADALRSYFEPEKVVLYSHPDQVQSAVARGAAAQA